MNRADRAVRWTLFRIPRRVHQKLPHTVKRGLNRWMRYRGDPGER